MLVLGMSARKYTLFLHKSWIYRLCYLELLGTFSCLPHSFGRNGDTRPVPTEGLAAALRAYEQKLRPCMNQVLHEPSAERSFRGFRMERDFVDGIRYCDHKLSPGSSFPLESQYWQVLSRGGCKGIGPPEIRREATGFDWRCSFIMI